MTHSGVLIALEHEEEFRSRVALDYTSRDFTAIRSQLVGLAKGLMPGWETVGESSDFGTLLIELFAYMGDVMNFYIDRTASEAFLGTAVRRQSVLYIADMLGYRPIGQQAASVGLVFSLDANAEEPITLPAGLHVYNDTDNANDLVVFELNGDLALTPGDIDIPATATEGVVIRDELLGTSLGIPNSEFILPNKGVVYNTISIRSDEGGQTLPWSFVTDLSLARPTQAVFTTFLDDTEYTHLVFGDNSSGRIPPVNANLYVTYRYGVGARANKLASNAVNGIAASTAPGLDLWGVSVRNPASPLGGTDPESIDSMRFSIPRAAARIKSRAVTLNDYADLALQVPGVAKSVSHGTVYTAVRVRIAPVNGAADDAYMQKLINTVEDYMKDKIIVGSTVYAEPADVDDLWQNAYIRLYVHVVEGYNRTSVREQVETMLRQALEFDAVDFGTRVTIGQIYRATLAVRGVEYAELRWLSPIAPGNEVSVMPEVYEISEGSTTLFNTAWQFSTSTTMADPTTEHYRANSTTNPTLFAFSTTDDDAVSRSAVLLALKAGDHFVVRPVSNTQTWFSMAVTGTPTNNTTWVQVPCAKVSQSATTPGPGANERVLFDFIRFAPDPVSPDNVGDIATDALLIPRIEPTEVVETEVNFPDLSEEERTHDGLWVVAVGGVPGS